MSDEKNVKKIDDPFEILAKISAIGRKEKEITVSEFKITLETLDSENENLIFTNTSGIEGSAYFAKHKIETLVYSISKINGKSLREYEKIENKEESKKLKDEVLDKVRSLIGKWNDNLIDYVYANFIDLTAESDKDLIKIGILKEKAEKAS